MSVKTIFWENRLTKSIRKPGGVTLEEALVRADSNLDSVKDRCLVALDEKLPLLKQFAAPPADPAARAEARQALYDLCSDVLNMARPAGFPHIGTAAYNFCDLIDRLNALQSDEWDSVVIHIETIGLLRGALAGNDEAAASLLDGLKKLVLRAAKAKPAVPATEESAATPG